MTEENDLERFTREQADRLKAAMAGEVPDELEVLRPGLADARDKWWQEWEEANTDPHTGRSTLGYDIEQGWDAAWACVEQYLHDEREAGDPERFEGPRGLVGYLSLEPKSEPGLIEVQQSSAVMANTINGEVYGPFLWLRVFRGALDAEGRNGTFAHLTRDEVQTIYNALGDWLNDTRGIA